MFLEKLLLINYRNYHYQALSFSPGLNMIIGDNAQGKTNLLESVFLSARGKSFKRLGDRDLIRFGERSGYVRADMNRNDRMKSVEIKLSMIERKRIRINEVEVDNIKDLSNQFEVVLFAPEDLQIIKDSPDFRRDFLDDLLKGIYPVYGPLLREYQKILSQRNNLLKSSSSSWFSEQLAALDRQLVDSAVELVEYRKQLGKELAEEAARIHLRLTDGSEDLQVTYRSNTLTEETASRSLQKEEFRQSLTGLLEGSRARDLDYRNTDIGPHKDDLDIFINGNPARKYASQGQSRTAVLTLRLAELAILEHYNRTAPILLLDDVFSELDQYRTEYLLKAIGGYQTLVTTNQLDGFPANPEIGQVFKVVNGQISHLK